ncbi:protein FAM81B [Rhincodon typus]|uniref:protein FAM81B n=1 Tax=Rhincodon typus TaxID=259920 RepID=UPI0009A3EF49|nr:protein FAM81B [Rhincodon typus]XP_048448390.1 protein FAM81B [Rhincodon typus]
MSAENLLLVQIPEKDHTSLRVPVVTKSHLQMMDDRISNQERTIATLLEQAFRNKEDIITHLRGNQGHYPVEKISQQLLENHIQVITSILKQLSTDIEILEEQIRRRDGVTTGTSFAIQSLNHKHLLGIGDLRGRVARCDANISKLAGDVSVTNNEIQKVKKDVQDAKSSLQEQMKELEIKVTQLLRNIDNSKCEHNTSLKTVRGELQHELQRLDFKITTALTEVHTQMQNHQKWAEYKLDKTEIEKGQRGDHFLHVMQEKTELMEKNILNRLNRISLRLEKLENQQSLDIESNRMKYSDMKINAKLAKVEKTIWHELESIKNEYREGFQSIMESINSLNKISEKKIEIDKEKIQKDLKQIRRQIIDLKSYP